MAPGAVALIHSGHAMIRSGDQHYPFRAHSDFFYLTGISQEAHLFAFAPDHPVPELREVLFIPRSTPKSELWTGPIPGPEEVQELSGIAQVSMAGGKRDSAGEAAPGGHPGLLRSGINCTEFQALVPRAEGN